MGAPILTIVGLPLLLLGRISEPKLRDVTIIAFWIIALVILMMLIYLNLFKGAISSVNIH
jgi:nitrate reductase gamma subunit